jgi:hypothetical protein
MPELAVTAFGPDEIPTVFLDQSDDVSNLHPKGRLSSPLLTEIVGVPVSYQTSRPVTGPDSTSACRFRSVIRDSS